MSNWTNHREEIIAWKKIRDELSREYRAGLTFALCNNLLLVCNCGSVTFKMYAISDYHVGVECTVCRLTKEVTL